MSENFNKLLKKKDKGFHEAEGLLTKLLRKMWFEMDFTAEEANFKMQRYLDRYHGSSGKAKSSARSNLIKEMSRPRMTWKTFTECLMFMSPNSVRFEVHMVWPKGTRVTFLDVAINGGSGETLLGEQQDDTVTEKVQYVDHTFQEPVPPNEQQLELFGSEPSGDPDDSQ